MFFEDIEALFDYNFSIQMLTELERHILKLNCFRTNVATPLDFVLNLLYAFEKPIFRKTSTNSQYQ